MITSFLVIFFFFWVIFFFAEGNKKKYSPKQKKILTNKRSYSSNGNTYIPMIYRFYAPPILNLIYLNFSFSEKKNITPKKKIYHFRRGQIFEDLRYKFRNNFKSWYTIFRVIFFYKTSDVKNCLGTWRKKKISQLKKKYQH